MSRGLDPEGVPGMLSVSALGREIGGRTILNDVSFNLQIGVPLPVFDKNQGKIYAAQSQILENHEKLQSAQNDLAARLAEIHAQYETQRALAEAYRREILPDQVRTYQGVAQGFRAGAEDVDFAQVIVTQQQLGQVVGEYINVLEAQWRAVVDLAEVRRATGALRPGQPAGNGAGLQNHLHGRGRVDAI